MKSQKPLCRKDNIVVQELKGEVLVYDLGANRAVCLNETSALIWQACDGSKTPAEISEFISKKLNTLANEDLVWLALDQLKKENLIENADALPNHFAGMSRRDAIKRVGLSSLIALPVIIAVTSPVAAASASVCVPNACYSNLLGGVPVPGYIHPADSLETDASGVCTPLCLCAITAGTGQTPDDGSPGALQVAGLCGI